MDILTNLQEYSMIGAISSIVLVILKYNGKQEWKVYPCIIYIGAIIEKTKYIQV